MRLAPKVLTAVGLLLACTTTVSSPAATQAVSTSTPPPSLSVALPTATVAPPGPIQFLAVQRIDARIGWVSVQSSGTPMLLRTQDGGSSWERLTLAQGTFVTRLAFVDAQNGWAVAQTPFGSSPASCRAAPDTCKSLLVTTTDGGRTWTQRVVFSGDLDRGPALISVAPADSRRAWITVRTPRCDPAGCAHEIRGTEDGGVTWSVLTQPAPFTATEIRRASVTTGWALAPGAVAPGASIIGTNDGGSTWSRQAQSPSWSPRSLASASDRAAWALFFDPSLCTASSCVVDLVRTIDGATWTSLGSPATGGCGGQLTQIAFGDTQTGWITVNLGAGGASGSGGVLRTGDGGRTWTCQTNPPNTVLVSAPSAQNVWVTSRDRTIAETLWASDDGGQTWRPLAIR